MMLVPEAKAAGCPANMTCMSRKIRVDRPPAPSFAVVCGRWAFAALLFLMGAGLVSGQAPLASPEVAAERFPRDPGEWKSMLGFGPQAASRAEGGPPGEGAASVQWTDPLTGVTVLQQRRWIPQAGCISLATTIAGQGARPVGVPRVEVAHWSFGSVEGSDALRYSPLAHRKETWYGSTFWSGPDWTRVGRDWQHPGENTASIRRFTAPRDGHVTIRGRVYKAHVDKATDGVRVTVRHGSRDVWQAELDGGDAQGLEPHLALEVRQGDAIRFIVHKRGKIFCDTTHWDPVIAYDQGPTFKASEGFLPRAEAGCPWSYEMEPYAPSDLRGVKVYGFAADGWLLELAPTADRPALLSGADALPLAVVADARDEGGVVVAIEPCADWSVQASLEADGRLRLKVCVGREKFPAALKPNPSVRLAEVVVLPYRGPWIRGLASLQAVASCEATEAADGATEGLRRVRSALCSAPWHRASGTGGGVPLAADYWAMIQLDWRRQDGPLETAEAFAAATAKHVEKARGLLAELRRNQSDAFLAVESQRLEALAKAAVREGGTLADRRALYLEVRAHKRAIALANPLMQFGKLLFCKRVPTSYSHLVMQYFGWRARPGGGLFVLEQPGRSLACREILNAQTVGRADSSSSEDDPAGKASGGSVLEPRLSWDARRIVFSFVKTFPNPPDPGSLDHRRDEGFYHIYETNVDGTGLRQLTFGPFDDLMPAYLPDGGIVFCSTRRRGYARCFGPQFSPRWHVYTLHRMDHDGKNLRTLSYHDTNEWFPAVSHEGLILYSRWDYIDRDAVTHQNLWCTRPDGSNPQALWGNATASPHCTFQIQPIPGSSKIVFTASAHHSITAGSIAIVDPLVDRDGRAALTRITPEVPFPEAESMNIPEYYEAPWPLSEDFFLVGYSPIPLVWEPGANAPNAVGIYLLDRWGNRELIYRDPEIGSTNPCPLTPRPRPPVLPSLPPDAPATGEMFVADVYQGLGDVPRGSIKELRVVQIFPKTTVVANTPPIGLAGEENGRAILGTVPVHPDGSARFTVPAHKPILFQVLDGNGMAYQTMRSVTYVQPGERVACVGCHEPRMSAPVRMTAAAAALRHRPAPLDPGPLGGKPFSFVQVVQPVLDKHCVRCHGGDKTEGAMDLTGTPSGHFTRSYLALCGDRNFWHLGTNPQNAAEALVPRFGARNQIQVSPPGGMYGARGSRLLRLLHNGHHEVKLTADEFRRLAAWIDLNAIFYGINDPADQARQLRGEPVAMPDVQ